MEHAATTASKPTVLLVEDYAPNVMVATTYLELFGYDWDVAENGFEAVEKCKAGDYAAVMMDVQMAGLDGLSATQQIRDHEAQTGKRRLPIIGVTALALTGDRERCLNAGMDNYASKPFNPDELKKMIDGYAAQAVA